MIKWLLILECFGSLASNSREKTFAKSIYLEIAIVGRISAKMEANCVLQKESILGSELRAII